MIARAAMCTSALLFAAPALGDAADIPEMLEAAIADAEARSANAPQLAFTRVVEIGDEFHLSARYDPARPEGERWTLVDAQASELSPDEQDAFDEFRDEEDPSGELLVDHPRELINGDITVLREDDDVVVYTAAAPAPDDGDEEGAAAMEAMSAEITVAKNGPRLVSFRLYARESFKPNVVARVNRFDMTMTFEEAWADGPLIAARMHQDVAGRAMFQSFEETISVEHSDVTQSP